MTIKLALMIWPLVAVLLFRRLSLQAAIIWTVLGGYLLLPTAGGIDLPILPTINKDLIPAVSAMLMATLFMRAQPGGPATQQILPGWLPASRSGSLLLMVLIVGTLLTAMTNGEALVYETQTLKGLTLYDGFSNVSSIVVSLFPLLLARKFLAHPDHHKTLLWILCLAGLLYSLPALYEVRMSPQLNRMIYGFSPSAWVQGLRGGGFRPVVFLNQGLWLGIFLCCALISAAVTARIPAASNRPRLAIAATLWLLMTLVLSKNFGALGIALLLVPLVLIFRPRVQLMVAAVIAALILFYPVLRGAGLVPTDRITSLVQSINDERSRSLDYRFYNEDILLEKARQKPLFGWGKWNRARAFDDKGRNISTIDGGWILSYGQGGWVGYLSKMGLMALPILLLALRRRQLEVTAATAGLCLALAANMIDLIPNDTLTPVTWLLAGALLGRLEVVRSASPALQAETVAAPPQPVSRYSRGAPRPAAVTPQPVASAPRARISYTRQTRPVPPADKTKT